jgi:hypothetical protein
VHGIYVSTTGSVVGNVVYRVAQGAIHLWHDATSVVIANNTVTNSGMGIIVGGGDFYHSSAGADNVRVVNNIVYDNRYGISEQGATGPHNTYRNNLVFGNPDGDWHLAEGMAHSGTVAAEPHFVAYTRDGTPDFSLAQDSPAIGKGLSEGDTGPDFLGKARPAKEAVDIGACQH